VTIPNPLPIQNGDAVKTFFDDHVCGISQVYFSGHDHSRQWIDEPTALCGTEMIVSGAGASYTSIQARGNKTFYEDASETGFMYVVIDGNTFTGEFYDANGTKDFGRTFTHP
jgi:tartrate-resistant acid phosphatase type 5